MTGKRILVAEDHDDLRRLARMTLDRAGFEVVEARDGDEAFEVAVLARPDALLTDLLMPRRDGRDLVLALRSRLEFSDLPVLVLTAAPDHPAAIELGRLPRLQVMAKPPMWARVVRVVEDMLNGQRAPWLPTVRGAGIGGGPG